MVASVKIFVLAGKSKHSVLKGAFSECLFTSAGTIQQKRGKFTKRFHVAEFTLMPKQQQQKSS